MNAVRLESMVSVEDIAKALQMSVKHVRDRVVREPDFPRPVLNRPRTRRWSRDSIERWLAQQQAQSQR